MRNIFKVLLLLLMFFLPLKLNNSHVIGCGGLNNMSYAKVCPEENQFCVICQMSKGQTV